MTEEHRKDALNGWLEALDRLENDAMCYRDGYGETRKDAETIRAALQSATISETQLESEIKKTAMSEKKAAFPEFIYVGRVSCGQIWFTDIDYTDVIKSNLSETKQLKYKQVDLETLKRVHPIRDRANGFYSSASHVVDGYNSAINDIKAKYGDLYAIERE